MKKVLLTLLIGCLGIMKVTGQEENSLVFHSNQTSVGTWFNHKGQSRALYNIITNEAYRLLDQRVIALEKIQSGDDWKKYQKDLWNKIFKSLEKFKKTPLRPQVTGVIEKETFTVEKIMFESHPNFFVTGGLFIPKNRQNTAPAIIYCSGHSQLAFRTKTYQRVILNLVNKGFVVFAMDPIGQGERIQYLDPKTGKSKVGGPTKEHTYAGIQTLMTGTSLSDYFIWDGVRVVDYLLTRKEIDHRRIGITGRSGGGAQSAMIAAYDDRIHAVASECYVTNFKRLLQSIGPQDAEQNIFRAIEIGFDFPDYFHLRAPKPSLIISTTNDFFNIQGARECFREAQKSYSALGKPDHIQFAEDEGQHVSTLKNREVLYSFFQKQLNHPGDPKEVDIELFEPDELWVTPSGQLKTSGLGETIFSLNQRNYSKTDLTETEVKEKLKELSGVDFSRKLTTAVYTGKYKSDSVMIEKYFLENTRGDFVLPVYVTPNEITEKDKVILWLSDQGKASILMSDKLLDYKKAGFHIVSVDLPGIGELFDKDYRGDGYYKGVPFNYVFGAHLIGKSIPGIHAEAIDLVVQFIQKEFKNAKISGYIEGKVSTAALVYVSQKNVFTDVKFHHPIEFDDDFIETEYYHPDQAFHIIPGSLQYFTYKEIIRKLKISEN